MHSCRFAICWFQFPGPVSKALKNIGRFPHESIYDCQQNGLSLEIFVVIHHLPSLQSSGYIIMIFWIYSSLYKIKKVTSPAVQTSKKGACTTFGLRAYQLGWTVVKLGNSQEVRLKIPPVSWQFLAWFCMFGVVHIRSPCRIARFFAWVCDCVLYVCLHVCVCVLCMCISPHQ